MLWDAAAQHPFVKPETIPTYPAYRHLGHILRANRKHPISPFGRFLKAVEHLNEGGNEASPYAYPYQGGLNVSNVLPVFSDHSRHKLWVRDLATHLDVLAFHGEERLSQPFELNNQRRTAPGSVVVAAVSITQRLKD